MNCNSCHIAMRQSIDNPLYKFCPECGITTIVDGEFLEELLRSINEEENAIADDIQELFSYERNLRQAIKSLEAYVKYWQTSLRRLTKEIETVEKKRFELESMEIIQKKVQKRQKDDVAVLLKQFGKLSQSQQAAIMAKIGG